MVHSMTGYGERSAVLDKIAVRVAVQALNSKQLDVRIEAPKSLASEVFEWRKLLGRTLLRGRIDVAIECHSAAEEQTLLPEEKHVKACFRRLSDWAEVLGAKADLFGLAVGLSRHRQEKTIVLDEPSKALLQNFLKSVLSDCVVSRAQEGVQLAQQLVACLAVVKERLLQVTHQAPKRITHLRNRLEEKIKIRESAVDGNRWEQEILYFLEKMDIEEECVRLKSHLTYFEETMQAPGEVGKKLGFIVQEMLREINTIGAKAQDVVVQRLVVEMKQAIEQMREQVRNIL